MNAFYPGFRRVLVTFCTLLCFSVYRIAPAQMAPAQDAATSSTRSAEKTREITRVLRPEIVNRLRDDNILVTQDVRFADKTALQRVARGGTHPTYIVITRTLPHPYKSAFTLARDIRLQLDTTSNAIVIVATEADGYLGVDTNDIEYSMSQQIATRSALSWTNEGYSQGAAQMLRLVKAQHEEQNHQRRLRLWLLFGVVSATLGTSFSYIRTKSRKKSQEINHATEI